MQQDSSTDDSTHEPRWALSSEAESLVAEVQCRLESSSKSWLARVLRGKRPIVPFQIRECGYGMRSSSGGDRYYAIRNTQRQPIGDLRCIWSSPSVRPRGDRSTVFGYCGVLFECGTTFELASSEEAPNTVVGYANGAEVCRITELPQEPLQTKGVREWLKKTFLGKRRWNVFGASCQLGTIELQYPVGSNRRRIYFETNHGLMPIQLMGPRWREGKFDSILPWDTPVVSDAELVVTHFLVNIAFRACIMHVELS
ncbi:MAG TPA: hypothetical protein VGJ26_09710 [Pirellulales bacterium]